MAIYRSATARGVQAIREPQVGNFAWEVFFAEPDGYKINFSSPTDIPEETLLSEIAISCRSPDKHPVCPADLSRS